MSLNGLDEPAVVEAHQAAVAEPGGWFLLKYASRDEVELMDRGNGGIVEIRNAISNYEDESPLYGYLRYRRRNVVIKYLPEDCSRLIQARVAVHFNAVCDRFSPYDTIFEISVAEELRDTKLSAACSLHAASGSTSSSTSSLRRRRLMEIAEEDEHEQRAPKRQSVVPETDGERPQSPAPVTAPVTLNSDLASSPEQSKFSAPTTSDVPKFVGVTERPASPSRRSIDTTDSRSDIYSLSSYTGKPKVKLGPRPSLDVVVRPHTAGNFRPVSAIPAGVKLFGKGQKKGNRKDSSAGTSPGDEISEINFPIISTTGQEESLEIAADGTRPATSTGVPIAALPIPAAPTKPAISPEKARLMKAMKLREKKKRQQQQAAAASAAVGVDDTVTEERETTEDTGERNVDKTEEITDAKEDDTLDEKTTGDAGERSVDETEEIVGAKEDDMLDEAKPEEVAKLEGEEVESQMQALEAEEKKPAAISQDDSGIVLDAASSAIMDQTSEVTMSDSRADSPVVASSDPDQSTAASSLSESTDETVQAKDHETQDPEQDATDTPAETNERSTLPDGEAASTTAEKETTALTTEQQKEGEPEVEIVASSAADSEITVIATEQEKKGEPEEETVASPTSEIEAKNVIIEEHEVKSEDATPIEASSKEDKAEDENQPEVATSTLESRTTEDITKEREEGEKPEEVEPKAEDMKVDVSSTASESKITESVTQESKDEQQPEEVEATETTTTTTTTTVEKEEPKEEVLEAEHATIAPTTSESSLEEDEKVTGITEEAPHPPMSEAVAAPTAEANDEANKEIPAGTDGIEKDQREPFVVPISKFSANIPTSSNAPPAAVSGGVASETVGIPPPSSPVDVVQTADKVEITSSPLRAPRSKFSTQDLVAATKAASQTKVSTPLTELESNPLSAAASSEANSSQGEPAAENADLGPPKGHSKRAVSIPPIKTDFAEEDRTASHGSENEVDDALMEELQSATVQEAKPMVVAKSPLTPVFPSPASANRPSSSGAPPLHTVRTVSNPVRGNLIVPTDVTQSSARSLSSGAAYLHKVTQQQNAQNLNTMKSNVGSSISQRIKALEKLSAQSGDPSSRPGSRERPSSTFFAVQKKDASRSPSVAGRTNLLKQNTPSPSPTPSQDSSPETSRVRLQRSGSVVSRLSVFETLDSPITTGPPGGSYLRGHPDSVSVTAKIVRDPAQSPNFDPPKDPSEYNYLDLKQSPLVVDHHTGGSSSHARSPSLDRDQTDGKGTRPSLGKVKGFFKDQPRSNTTTDAHKSTVSRINRSPTRPESSTHQSTASHRLSMSSRRSSIGKDREALQSSGATEGSVSGDEKSDKKISRAGRFMRRLSNLSGASKGKNSSGFSPPLPEEKLPPVTAVNRQPSATPSASATSSVVSELGDVNVQFPDNLLWKRRNLSLDSQGFIILSALPAQGGRTAQGTKRYHMSEFRQPYTPDVEVQELPNSVVLDFVEGAGIQLACEDRTGQLNVLKVLRDAHGSHGTFGR